MFSDPNFWFSVLGLVGFARIIEMLLRQVLTRNERRVEYGMANLKFMTERLEAMEEEIERQKDEIKQLRVSMHDLKVEYKHLKDTLYEVTETVEQHGDEDIVKKVKAIPGVPDTGLTIGLGD